MRRALLLLALSLTCGCKTVEVSVDYPLAGVHIAAKIQASDQVLAAMAEATSANLDGASLRE